MRMDQWQSQKVMERTVEEMVGATCRAHLGDLHCEMFGREMFDSMMEREGATSSCAAEMALVERRHW